MNLFVMGKNPRAGKLACFLLALACLVAAFYQFRAILPLVNDGLTARAEVVAVVNGVKGTKRAVYRFTTDVGETITAKDLFTMYLNRPHLGEKVSVFYDPTKPQRVIADLGPWTWQGPVIFWAGFVLLTTLGILLHRHETANPPAEPGK